jgi:regulator of sigma D
MPNHSNDPQQQFRIVEELLTRWLKARRGLLSKYTEIVVAIDGDFTPQSLEKRQRKLCELLVDYCSAGHFEVFHELLDEAESFNDGSDSMAAILIPGVGDTTEVILAYEEKYGTGNTQDDKLERDLSALGEVLESRFELEDRLIAGLHNRHRRHVVAPAAEQI